MNPPRNQFRITDPAGLKRWAKANYRTMIRMCRGTEFDEAKFLSVCRGHQPDDRIIAYLLDKGCPPEFVGPSKLQEIYNEYLAHRVSNPSGVRRFLRMICLPQVTISRSIEVSRELVSGTIKGKYGSRRVLAHLREIGCPEEYLTGKAEGVGGDCHSVDCPQMGEVPDLGASAHTPEPSALSLQPETQEVSHD